MPLLQINAGHDGLELHRAAQSVLPTLRRALRSAGPIVVMLHGYKFAPGHARSCPHRHILSLQPVCEGWKVKSWPRALGFGENAQNEGIAIAFGWQGRGTIWQACDAADRAAVHLADLLEILAQLAPRREVNLIAHSLGARVVLRALPLTSQARLGRVILLNGAEFSESARAALLSAVGAQAEFINITSRENDLFDFLLERLISAPISGDRCLAHNLPDQVNTLTLQLDHPDTIEALTTAGFALAPGSHWVCHWSAYLRPGVFDFYRALLRQPERTSFTNLRNRLPLQPEPRWSKIIPGPRRRAQNRLHAI